VKNLFVLRVNDYRPDLCRYTLPTIRGYAEKIGAKYVEITERVWPDWPVTYEKLQVHTLGAGADWNLLVDADFMLHPDLPDFTKILPPHVVGFHYGFNAANFFKSNIYFERCGHSQAIAGGFVLTSRLTHDLWTPLDMPLETALDQTKRAFIIDEYTLSRNLARFGLKFSGVEASPLIGKLMVHIGNEEKPEGERQSDVLKAKALFEEWGFEP
jgi:hypothetical protein